MERGVHVEACLDYRVEARPPVVVTLMVASFDERSGICEVWISGLDVLADLLWEVTVLLCSVSRKDLRCERLLGSATVRSGRVSTHTRSGTVCRERKNDMNEGED